MTTPGAALSGGGASPPEEARLNRQREPLPTDVASLPQLPAAYDAVLTAALGVLGLPLMPEARSAIDGHVRLLLAWNAAINLTAITDPAEVALRHVADSLAATDAIRSGPHATLLDLGSGGGYPGLPLAAVLPETRVLLVDSTAKKVAFLDAARRALGLAVRVEVAAARAESLRRPPGPVPGRDVGSGWDVVTARAVGPLADLIELALPLLATGGRLVAWKRGDISTELAAGARAAAALGGSMPVAELVPEALGLAGHALVVVGRESPTPEGYPRDPGARKRRPW
ncbi:MAG: 16S rRNA (guanine(527)-N(7))-methyltransferase RsmG [Chloroflexi bacterium]|nr:16S rRNA (guanine(527)-N(7))-methyltransferase RsmG [Chloroflexota bacterium]